MMIGIPLWSFFLSRLWKVDDICSAAFVMYGLVVGVRFAVFRTASADRQSCKLYSVSDLASFENSTHSFIILALVYHRALTPWLLAIFLRQLKLFKIFYDIGFIAIRKSAHYLSLP